MPLHSTGISDQFLTERITVYSESVPGNNRRTSVVNVYMVDEL